MSEQTDTPPAAEKESGLNELELYKAVIARRVAHNNLVWSTPALSLTAQSFLLTISLSSFNTPLSRILASLLSSVAACASIQLLAKHRAMEYRDSKWLEAFELKNLGMTVHGRPTDLSPFEAISSVKLWDKLLKTFLLVSVAILLTNLIRPQAFDKTAPAPAAAATPAASPPAAPAQKNSPAPALP